MYDFHNKKIGESVRIPVWVSENLYAIYEDFIIENKTKIYMKNGTIRYRYTIKNSSTKKVVQSFS